MIGATAETTPFNDSNSDSSTNRLHTVISMMGDPKKFFYCGGLGNGLVAKISNNYLAGTILLATAEALAIGIRSGIDKHVLHQVIQNSTGQSWMCDHVHPVPGVVPHVPSSHDYTPGFKTQMMIKDIQLGIDAGLDTAIEPTMAKAAMEVWKRAAVDPLCRVGLIDSTFF
jgi:3-hydroxyisobutyrate dehydrogenase-like beta-hydroxyacid dehydrogenase